MGKAKVTDVARLAGVSIGTVDRVLHNRGEVSQKTKEKVQAAIKELGYELNVNASLLAKKSDIIIACILPEHDKGEYWEEIGNGYRRGKDEASKFGVGYKIFSFDQYRPDSYIETCAKVLDTHPEGVILPPFFPEETLEFTGKLIKKGIPYILIDSKLENNGHLAFFGTQMYNSGRLCAFLLTERCRKEEVREILMLRLQRDKDKRADPTVSRRKGFNAFITEKFPDCTIYNFFIDPHNISDSEKELQAFLDTHPSLNLVTMLSSRIHLASGVLSRNRRENMRVIGFDNLDKNIAALKAGSVDIIIASKISRISRMAFCTLAEHLALKKEVSEKDCHLHLDILTRYNIENY